ncbi:MAG: DNA-binding transcriptional regulator ModE [Euryarchaeota archaeon ADurb.BinA087]|nr:MAG: DNA-binding transcriptional regulator ModE [Euryarchaeota archaeon ADurb.BinA087]
MVDLPGQIKYLMLYGADNQLNKVNFMKISARNQIPGTVKMIKKGPVTTEVVMSVGGGLEIVSTITTHSAETMKLREGSKVYAVMKASEVMVGID